MGLHPDSYCGEYSAAETDPLHPHLRRNSSAIPLVEELWKRVSVLCEPLLHCDQRVFTNWAE